MVYINYIDIKKRGVVMMKKSILLTVAALLTVSTINFTLPQKAEAINLGSVAVKAVGAAQEQQKINKSLDYKENVRRFCDEDLGLRAGRR